VLKTAEENISKYNEKGKRLFKKLFKKIFIICALHQILVEFKILIIK
jgi:hypothetical protein